MVYLTFDVGYENGNVEKAANILRKQNVTAAFFTLPHFLKKNQELVKRLKDDGNLICNHTYSHKDMSKYTSFEEFEAELVKNEKLYYDLYGCEMSKFYRPPEGKFSEANLAWAQKMDYTTIFWRVAYADWDEKCQPDPRKAFEKLKKRTHNGAVILLHPTSSTNAAILEEYILYLKDNGYRFGSVSELCQANSGAGAIIPSNGKIMCKNSEAKKK
ncbi:Peptidoglycan-N-acetylmuramic acid deacetylase PdaA [bioreactor metagenome]|uniref:Peptidoglycan-N-acetylmuramic acid deacetylase PdaA n=1 Tax=bioreactor metagenome TaxID=1076179 RepID=A0A645FCM2_9ZZZZ